MNKKKTLSTTMLLLLAFSVLSLLKFNLVRVAATPVSPYIMVNPEKTWDSTYTVGSEYTVSIYTDYNPSIGSDLYMWQFSLTFNPSILEGLEVTNGDLITTAKHSSAAFAPGTFDNTVGKLSLTVAYFYHSSPPPYRTSGPGTLANVKFRVKGYGASDIHISDTVSNPPTILGGYDIAGEEYYSITDGTLESEKLGHGLFRNTLPGDIQGDTTGSPPDRDVDYYDFLAFAAAYLSTSGQPAYNPLADMQGDTPGSPSDGDVDYYDFLLFAGNYLKTIP